MKKTKKYIVLRIASPLMSFGVGDYWDIRGTEFFPTKSAIVGILSSCFGYDRNEYDKIKKLSDKISVSCRKDSEFMLLRDYHTIMDTLKADGNLNSNAVQSYRNYIIEGEFSVLIFTEDSELFKNIKNALENPVWPPFLGRKSCIPSYPIFLGEEIEAENAIEAFKKLKLINDVLKEKKIEINKSTKNSFLIITDEIINSNTSEMSVIRDNVTNSQLRIFSQREIYKFYV